jgi:hypothetical protein
MQINHPAVIAELMERHVVYEKALINNDVATLDSLFWDSPHAIRYGVTENLHGTEEIRAFRKGRPAINLARTISRLDVMTLGDTAGIVNLEFARGMDGVERSGRQTQFWFRFEEGWRIVSAHVSLLPAAPSYADAAAATVGLAIDPANRSGVKEDLARLTIIARFLMEFPLSQDVEAAPVFYP